MKHAPLRRLYRRCVPRLVAFALMASALLQGCIFVLGRIGQRAIEATGRVAVTSGDFVFVFTTPQGWLLVVVALAMLYLCVGFDLSTTIVYADRAIESGGRVWAERCLREGLASLRRLLSPAGLLVVLYIALVVPLVSLGTPISLTSNLYVPSFITSVIFSKPLYLTAYVTLLVALGVLGFVHLFVLHGVVLDGMGVREAARMSRALVRLRWADMLRSIALYAVGTVGVAAVSALVLVGVPFGLGPLLSPADDGLIGVIFACYGGLCAAVLGTLLAVPLYQIKLTQLYRDYHAGTPQAVGEIEHLPLWRRLAPSCVICLAFGGIAALSWVSYVNFDKVFPVEIPQVIAHRAGGSEGPENTLAGLERAIELGAEGAEIDIQRTADGAYVVLHDDSFARVAGDAHKPNELTLAQVAQLRAEGEPVPTLEEMLDASRGNLTLYVELKGATADEQMADDAVAAIRARHMEAEAALISLKYDLIRYVRATYPDIQTAYLAFASFGDTAQLSCDALALEEEAATPMTIDAIHEAGRSVLVWTPDTEDELQSFMGGSDADAVITDSVELALQIATRLSEDKASRVFLTTLSRL